MKIVTARIAVALIASLAVATLDAAQTDIGIVNPAGTVLLKKARVSHDGSTAYAMLGNGLKLHAGADGVLGTADDVVKGFGRYPQSDVSGAKPDPLDWRILDMDDNSVTLMASVLVDGAKFNLNAGDGNDWSTSNLRSWLNSTGGQDSSGDTRGFYNVAFNPAERAKILPAHLGGADAATFIAYNRLLSADWWHQYPSASTPTTDRVWAPSGAEVFRYFGRSKIATEAELKHDPANYTNAYVIPSAYAKARGVKVNTGGNGPSFVGFGDAWTRSAGAPADTAGYYGVFLGSTGSLNSGRLVDTAYGVLPVIRVARKP